MGGEEDGVEDGEGGPRVDGETNACIDCACAEAGGSRGEELLEALTEGELAKFLGETGGVGKFAWSRILVCPSDSPLSCNALIRSAIEADGVISLDSLVRRSSDAGGLMTNWGTYAI